MYTRSVKLITSGNNIGVKLYINTFTPQKQTLTLVYNGATSRLVITEAVISGKYYVRKVIHQCQKARPMTFPSEIPLKAEMIYHILSIFYRKKKKSPVNTTHYFLVSPLLFFCKFQRLLTWEVFGLIGVVPLATRLSFSQEVGFSNFTAKGLGEGRKISNLSN